MSNLEWKEGFEAGIDFVVTFANEQLGYKFNGIAEMMFEIDNLKTIKRLYEAQIKAKEQS